jgi:hypothetical protein
MSTTGRSGSHCLENSHLSLIAPHIHHHLFRLVPCRSSRLPRHCSFPWHCLRLRPLTRHRHLTLPTQFMVPLVIMLPFRTDLPRRLRHYHTCLSAALPLQSLERGVGTTTQPSLQRSVSPAVCRSSPRPVIPHRSATTHASRCLAFQFRRAHHKTGVRCRCRCRRPIIFLHLMSQPEQWVWSSRHRPDRYTLTQA